MADDLTQIPVDDLIERAVAAQRLHDADEGWAPDPELQELTERGTADIQRRALAMLDDDDPARRTTAFGFCVTSGSKRPSGQGHSPGRASKPLSSDWKSNPIRRSRSGSSRPSAN
jgi:hypothetical protein